MKASMEQVLLYHFNDPERLQKIKQALLCMKVKSKVVEPEQYHQPIGALVGLTAPTEAEQDSEISFSDEMMVLHRFTSRRLDELLVRLRKAKIVVPYKAVLTETNLHWSGTALLEELKKEHEAMQAGTMAHETTK